MIIVLFFLQILIPMLAVTFLFGDGDVKSGLIIAAILFIVSLLIGGSLIIIGIIAYVLFLMLFKMEKHSAAASVALLICGMFLIGLLGLL